VFVEREFDAQLCCAEPPNCGRIAGCNGADPGCLASHKGVDEAKCCALNDDTGMGAEAAPKCRAVNGDGEVGRFA